MYLKFILMYFCSIWYVTCQYSGASLIIWTSLIRIIHLSGHLFRNQSLFHLCENSMFCASDAVKFDLWTLTPHPGPPPQGLYQNSESVMHTHWLISIIYQSFQSLSLKYPIFSYYPFDIISPDPAPRGRIKIPNSLCTPDHPYLIYP